MMTTTPSTSGTGIALKGLLDVNHAMVKLSAAIDWDEFTAAFGAQYHDDGRPSVPIRVMVGLHYLKYLFNESDEGVVKKWVENPYWQYFCGCETFQHDLPCHSSSLSKWRKRIGEAGAERLFKVVIETAMKSQALAVDNIKQVTVDTTVQAKAIAFPTDARLAHKARRALVRAAKAEGIKLRQTYERASKAALFLHSRYATARQFKRATRQTRKLQVFLGRVIRDVRRKHAQQQAQPAPHLVNLLDIAQRILTQRRHDSSKCYSVHAPEVACIAKGKVNQKYEFGCKVAVTTTTQTNWIVGIQAHHGNPYDGATLTPALTQVEQMTGLKPEQALVDQGFRGPDHHPPGVKVLIVRATAKVTATVKALFKRRSAIEPIIGHTKHDHGLCRNHLHGILGDKMNALLVGCGFNLAKLLHFFALPQPTPQPA